MEENINCPVCGTKESSFQMSVLDHMVSKEAFDIRSCNDCGMQRTDPRPTQIEISKYYDSSLYLSHKEDGKSFFDKLYNILRAYNAFGKVRILENVKATKSRTPRLLDVGCGIGVFLEHAQYRKWSVFGVELIEKARKIAENRLKSPIFEKLDDVEVDTKFDVISMWHVLEHLEEPDIVLKRLHGLAVPGAVLVLGLPNRESIDSKHYAEHWAAYDVPIHFWHFTKADIERIATNTGWALEQVRPMYLDAFYVSLLSESYKHGKKRWLSAFLWGLYSNVLGAPKNTSSLVYVLRRTNI